MSIKERSFYARNIKSPNAVVVYFVETTCPIAGILIIISSIFPSQYMLLQIIIFLKIRATVLGEFLKFRQRICLYRTSCKFWVFEKCF